MFSRCPHCEAQQPLSTEQLRNTRGLVNCAACGQVFDALPSLSEQADEIIEPSLHFSYAMERPAKRASSKAWGLGSALMLLLLLGQMIYFAGARLYQQPVIYKALVRLCQKLNCELPAYNNPDDWSISHSDLQANLDQRYVLTAAITNQANLRQAFPDLKLTLMDFTGQPFAERRFAPKEYSHQAALAANQTVQIRLPLVVPADVGGFSITLI